MFSLLWSFFLLYDLFIDLHVYAFILTQISWSHNWYTCITFLVTEMCFTSFFKFNYLILQMLFSLFRIFNSWLTVLLERTQWWKFFLTRWAWVSDFRCRDGYRNQQWLNNQLKTHYEFYMVMYRLTGFSLKWCTWVMQVLRARGAEGICCYDAEEATSVIWSLVIVNMM